jgi:presenilin-like A22 family membrane protease
MKILFIFMLIVSLNFILTMSKFRRNRIFDGIVDACLLALICYLFRGSFNALVVGAGASLVISLYLEFFPLKNPAPKFDKWVKGWLFKK